MMTEVCGHDTETDWLHIVSKWEITKLEKANNISLFTTAFKHKQTVVHVRRKLHLGSALKKLIYTFQSQDI